MNVPPLGSGVMAEETLDESRARAVTLLSPKDYIMLTKRRYVTSPSISIALTKATTDFAPEKSIILFKNIRESDMGKISDEKNQAVSSSTVITAILSKEIVKVKDDARDNTEKLTLERKGGHGTGETFSARSALQRGRISFHNC